MCKFHWSKLQASEPVDGNYESKQGKQVGTRNKLTHTQNKVTHASRQDPVHDSAMFTETDRFGPLVASAKDGKLTRFSVGNVKNTGIPSVSSIGFADITYTTGASVSDGNEPGTAMEVYQLSIVDSISCSTDLEEFDTDLRNIVNDLMEES